MSGRQIHPDWPEVPDGSTETWLLPDPLGDFASTLEAARGTDDVTLADVALIHRYRISSNDGLWAPGSGSIGTELELSVVGRLVDGRWFAAEGWNDYTGWGCQDGADLLVGATEDEVVYDGLSKEARGLLGYSERAR